MTLQALVFTLAAIGISETAYLIQSRRESSAPVCYIGHSCNDVLESRYNKLFAVRNDVLGLAFYAAVAALAALVVVGVEPAHWWLKAQQFLALAGSAVSLALTFVQWRILRQWRFWCIMSAITVLLMALIIIIMLAQ